VKRLPGSRRRTASRSTARARQHGVVRVALPLELGASNGALFTAFLVEHPRIRIEVTFTNRGAELVGDLVDIAVAIGKLPDSSLVTKRVGQAANGLYAAPSYIERYGRPRTFADLRSHRRDPSPARTVVKGAGSSS